LAGGTLNILKNFTVKNWVDAMRNNKVTFTIPVSSHLHQVIEPLLEKPFRFPSLRCIVSSSSAINDDVKRRLFEKLPCEFHEMYGASEVATATNLNKTQAKLKLKSVGLPNPNVEIRIVNDQMIDCPPNALGQIIVKSPLASSGYYDLPEITSASFSNGYFLTGDIGYLDDEGFLYFVDRKKDIIISGGINIYPSDIECVINEMQEVKESYVLGIHDVFLGEVPVAVIISDFDQNFLEKILRANIRHKLAAYQRPFKYFFMDKVPLTDSGKVDKRKLRDQLNSLKLDLSLKFLATQNMHVMK
jgi:acyl-CoA synthetase (AMP-forming)/AMP-acid ligase II